MQDDREQQLIEHLKEYLLFVLSMRSSSKQNLQNKTKLTPLKYKIKPSKQNKKTNKKQQTKTNKQEGICYALALIRNGLRFWKVM